MNQSEEYQDLLKSIEELKNRAAKEVEERVKKEEETVDDETQNNDISVEAKPTKTFELTFSNEEVYKKTLEQVLQLTSPFFQDKQEQKTKTKDIKKVLQSIHELVEQNLRK